MNPPIDFFKFTNVFTNVHLVFLSIDIDAIDCANESSSKLYHVKHIILSVKKTQRIKII